jgi:cytochrome P450
MPEQEAALPRYADLPFGAGSHMCIGNHFAMLEAHLILATFAQRVTFELVPGQTIVPEPLITLDRRAVFG